jgi:hypothetical protein
MDLTTTASVTTITHGVSVVQPTKSAYATAADLVNVQFTASDPDDPGSTPTTHFNIIDETTGTVLVQDRTGTSTSLSAQGDYRLQYWSTDSGDSEPTAAHSILIAIDRTAPTITIDSVSPQFLWPPNGKFVTVTVTGVAKDTLSGVDPNALRYQVQDEYGEVQPSGSIIAVSGSGPTAFGGFQEVHFSFQVSVQARRFGFDLDGRQYTIDVMGPDLASNVGSASTVVTVPHDMRHHPGTDHLHGEGGGQGGEGVHRVHHLTGGVHGGGGGSQAHGHHGKAGGQPGQGSPTSGMAPVMGPLPSRGNQGDHGNGNGNGDNGNGNGNGNGHGNGNGNGHGKGHG